MKRTRISEIWAAPESFSDKTVTVCGWARTLRDQKNFGFIELNDGSSFKGVQVVIERQLLENYGADRDRAARSDPGRQAAL